MFVLGLVTVMKHIAQLCKVGKAKQAEACAASGISSREQKAYIRNRKKTFTSRGRGCSETTPCQQPPTALADPAFYDGGVVGRRTQAAQELFCTCILRLVIAYSRMSRGCKNSDARTPVWIAFPRRCFVHARATVRLQRRQKEIRKGSPQPQDVCAGRAPDLVHGCNCRRRPSPGAERPASLSHPALAGPGLLLPSQAASR
jgi:hypothetical protein